VKKINAIGLRGHSLYRNQVVQVQR